MSENQSELFRRFPDDAEILVLSGSDWTDNAVSNMQIAAELSNMHSVTYIETMGRRVPKFSEYKRVFRRLVTSKNALQQDNKALDRKNVNVLSPIALPFHKFRLIRRLNVLMVRAQFKSVLRKLDNRKLIIWTYSPLWLDFIEVIDPKCLVFHIVDALHTYNDEPYFRDLYDRLVERSTVIITPSQLIADSLENYKNKLAVIGHGVGEAHVSPDLSGAKGCQISSTDYVIVYAGTLANWVDYDALIHLMESVPKVKLLLIGYIHALAPKDKVALLLSFENVVHVGYQNYDELPSFYSKSRLGIVPYSSSNEHIYYSTPTKFLDYFAANLPVVSSRFPASETMPTEFVDLYSSKEELVSCVERRMESVGLTANECRDFALEHTWEKQVIKMIEAILTISKRISANEYRSE